MSWRYLRARHYPVAQLSNAVLRPGRPVSNRELAGQAATLRPGPGGCCGFPEPLATGGETMTVVIVTL